MKNIEEGIEILKKLETGQYVCIREVDRGDFSAKPLNAKEQFLFEKQLYSDGSGVSYDIIGSDCPMDEEELLENCYGEFTPLEKITKIELL